MNLKDIVLNFDHAIFFFFQKLQRPWLDAFLAWPTRFGETLLDLSLLVSGILIFDRKNGPRKIPAVVTGMLATCWASQWLKAFFNRPRPYVFWEHVHIIYGKAGNAAFPSGHTATIFAAAYLLDYLYPKKMFWMYGVAVWVAVTRLYVGVHYPTDLVAGAVVGIACAALCCRFVAPASDQK